MLVLRQNISRMEQYFLSFKEEIWHILFLKLTTFFHCGGINHSFLRHGHCGPIHIVQNRNELRINRYISYDSCRLRENSSLSKISVYFRYYLRTGLGPWIKEILMTKIPVVDKASCYETFGLVSYLFKCNYQIILQIATTVLPFIL